jgi:hypothetical protein
MGLGEKIFLFFNNYSTEILTGKDSYHDAQTYHLKAKSRWHWFSTFPL